MTTGTRLDRWVDHAVVKHAPETERGSAMADATVDSHIRMTVNLTNRIDTVVTTRTIAGDVTVINKCGQKLICGMTGFAVATNRRGNMSVGFARRGSAIMAGLAIAGNTAMIKSTVSIERQETVGGVAIIAFRTGCHMKC